MESEGLYEQFHASNLGVCVLTISRLVLTAVMAAAMLAGWGALSSAVPATERIKPGAGEDEDYGGLPEGPGREEVYYVCQACHSLAIVKQQGLDRESWDETLVWMVKEQEMPPLDPENRRLVLDYLATHYGRDSDRQ